MIQPAYQVCAGRNARYADASAATELSGGDRHLLWIWQTQDVVGCAASIFNHAPPTLLA
jgi:hypothetical protein